jgi:RHS repeat-associated protein
VTTYGYDAANQQTSITDPLGDVRTTAYDADGHVTSVTDPLGHATSKGYDADGRLTTVTDPLGNTTTFGYDPDGRPTTLKDANGHTWKTTYDADGNRISRTDPLNRTTTNSYDAADELTGVTDPSGKTTSYGYDPDGRRTSANYPGGTSATYEYDADGRLTSRTDSAGSFAKTYDADGRVTSTTDALGQTVSYTYDAAGRVINRTQPGPATTTLGYDADGRITSASDAGGNATWSYDAAGLPTGATLPDGVVLVVTSDADHRVTGLSYKKSGSTVFSETLGYDAAGQVSSLADPTGSHAYSYDADARLISDTTGSATTSWTYDAVGSRASQTVGSSTTNYSYDAADELTTAGSTAYTYDARGNLTEINNSSGATTYSYDGANHLTDITTPIGSWTLTVADDGTVLKQTGTTTSTYLTDPISGDLLAQNAARVLQGAQIYGVTSAGATSVLALDTLGSARAVIPSSGSAAAINYSAWGGLLSTVPGGGVPGYTGGIPYPDGTTHLGARTLDSTTGRWTTQDPLSLRESKGQDSLYAYVDDSPLTLTDSTGQFGLSSITGAFKAAVSYGSRAVSSAFTTAWHTAGGFVADIKAAFSSPAPTVNRATGSLPTSGEQDSVNYNVAGPDRSRVAASGPQYSTIGGVSGIDCSGVYAQFCAYSRGQTDFYHGLSNALGSPEGAATGPARGAITQGSAELINNASDTSAGTGIFSAFGLYQDYKTLSGASQAYNQYQNDISGY